MIRASAVLLLILPATGWGEEPARRRPAKGADEAPVHQPLISRPVRLVFQDNFDRPALGTGWKAPKGGMRLVEGALVGETPNRQVRASCAANLAAPTQNLGLTFRIKLGSANVAGVGVTGKPAGETGPVFAVWVGSKQIQLNADTGGIDRKVLEIDPNEWHDVMVECVGNRVVVQLNGEKVLEGENPTISRFPKRGVAFVVDEGAASIDQIVAGEVAPK